MAVFAGWEMPLFYKGVLAEHEAVRQRAGLFDVSHMGRIMVTGREAEAFLDSLSTNRVAGRPDKSAVYTVLPNAKGGSIDDVLLYRYDATRFFVIVNAGNRSKDLSHLLEHSRHFDVVVEDHFNTDGGLALQGPLAQSVMVKLFPEVSSLKSMHFVEVDYRGRQFPVSATGYTGSGGFEVWPPQELLEELWKGLLEEGRCAGIEPVGLGARDTLRLEMGYALYGHELSETIAPIESVAHWTVKWDKGDFLGRQALWELERGPHRFQYGAVLTGEGVPREGCSVESQGAPRGVVTSGTFSPSLRKGIAIVMVDRPLFQGDRIEIQVRDHLCQAEVASFPFIQPQQEIP